MEWKVKTSQKWKIFLFIFFFFIVLIRKSWSTIKILKQLGEQIIRHFWRARKVSVFFSYDLLLSASWSCSFVFLAAVRRRQWLTLCFKWTESSWGKNLWPQDSTPQTLLHTKIIQVLHSWWFAALVECYDLRFCYSNWLLPVQYHILFLGGCSKSGEILTLSFFWLLHADDRPPIQNRPRNSRNERENKTIIIYCWNNVSLFLPRSRFMQWKFIGLFSLSLLCPAQFAVLFSHLFIFFVCHSSSFTRQNAIQFTGRVLHSTASFKRTRGKKRYFEGIYDENCKEERRTSVARHNKIWDLLPQNLLLPFAPAGYELWNFFFSCNLSFSWLRCCTLAQNW